MIKGVLFDMDGVLLDSERFICEAAIRMFKEYGVNAKPEDFIPFVGAGENRYVGGVAEKYGVNEDIEMIKARTYEIYDEITRGKLEPLDGAVEFVKHCRQKGLKTAVATSADHIKLKINLREIGVPEETFDATINGLEVEKKKPHPDIFIKAAERVGLKPQECLVVEDAVNGVEAAKQAGAKCLALTTSFSEKELSAADWIAASLNNVPDDALNW